MNHVQYDGQAPPILKGTRVLVLYAGTLSTWAETGTVVKCYAPNEYQVEMDFGNTVLINWGSLLITRSTINLIALPAELFQDADTAQRVLCPREDS